VFILSNSAFDDLHSKLQRRFKNIEIPALPSKGFSFGAQTEEFLATRLKGLEVYLQAVINTSVFQTDSNVLKFFDMNLPPHERQNQATYVDGKST